MTRTVVEFFKIQNGSIIPVEFRFINCKVIFDGKEHSTCEWMNRDLWKELIGAAKKVITDCEAIKKLSSIQPTLSTTCNLKLAFIVKDNVFKRPIFMVSDCQTEFLKPLLSFDSMLIMSVSLNNPSVKLQDLTTAISPSQGEGQTKISSYFMQPMSFIETDK